EQTFEILRQSFPYAHIHNSYGATETTSPAALMPVYYPEKKALSVGPPVYGADIKIVNEKGEACAIGEFGELYIRGPMVITKYWENDEANKQNFSDEYWHSGDIGFFDEDGYLYIRDRKKDMINRAG